MTAFLFQVVVHSRLSKRKLLNGNHSHGSLHFRRNAVVQIWLHFVLLPQSSAAAKILQIFEAIGVVPRVSEQLACP